MLITRFFQSRFKLSQSRFKLIGALSCVALLAACGGGGGGGGKTSVPSSVVASSASSTASVVASSASSLSVSSASSSVAPDVTPDAFSFTPVTGAPINASITSASITISGINTASPISITGGQYSIAGSTATSATGTITNGQTVVVSLTAAAALGVTTQATLTIGGVAQTFSVTTELPDTTPDTFSFTPVTGAPINASIASTSITISGINTAVPISITGGQYTIGSGAPTSEAGTITNGQTVTVTLLTSAAVGTSTQAVLTVGGVESSFVATTSNLMGGAAQGAPLNIAGVVTTLAGTPPDADGIGLAASFYHPNGITSDGTHLYVSDSQNNKIRQIVIATGEVTTLAGSGLEGSANGTGTAASFDFPNGITTDGTHLYVTDCDNHKIRKIVISTGEVTTFAGSGSRGSADGIGTAANFNNPCGITRDGAHLYVTDKFNHKIRQIVIATGEVTTLAGSGSQGSADGIGMAASFRVPEGIITDGAHLYVADSSNHKIRKIVIATGEVTTLAGSGLQGSADGTGTVARFNYPAGITSDGTHLYVADPYNHKIRKILMVTGEVTTLAGSGSEGSADGTAAASFNGPRGVTSDGTHLYVADRYNHKIRKIVIATGEVTTLAGSDSKGSADGTGTATRFQNPAGITSDGTYLYVADPSNNKIRQIVIATGEVTTLAGSGLEGSVDGTGIAASFSHPTGITTDGTHLYVADYTNNKIRQIVIATGEVTTLAGNGSNGSADGIGTAASFYYPKGITTDGTHLYVTDHYNHKIRKIVIATGEVATLAGGGSFGSADGIGTVASFYYPSGITTDGTHLYVADSYNYTIRKIEIATGEVTTLAGSGSQGSADGTGTAASFYVPMGITSDGTHLYVADSYNNTIRKIEMATAEVITLAGSGSRGSADGTGTAASFNYPRGITTDGFELFVADTVNNTVRKIH